MKRVNREPKAMPTHATMRNRYFFAVTDSALSLTYHEPLAVLLLLLPSLSCSGTENATRLDRAPFARFPTTTTTMRVYRSSWPSSHVPIRTL